METQREGSIDDLSRQTGEPPRILYAAIDSLVSYGLVRRNDEYRWERLDAPIPEELSKMARRPTGGTRAVYGLYT